VVTQEQADANYRAYAARTCLDRANVLRDHHEPDKDSRCIFCDREVIQ
jgi:hypothetical protein